MSLVNFMVIGAVKAGTTSIYHYLKQHPQIYLTSIKETKFFQWDGEEKRFSGPLDPQIYEQSIKSFEEYQALFSPVSNETAVGEVTPSYLYNKEVPLRIHRRFPDVKMIVILRQPAERAFSHYLHTKWLGYEPLSFSEALAQEEKRIRLNWGPSWHYKQQGFYYAQVKRFLDLFGEEQIRVYLFDEFVANTPKTIENMYGYLGVEAIAPNVSQKYNERFFPKNQVLHQLTNQPNFTKSLLKTMLPEGIKRKLMGVIAARNSWKPQLSQHQRDELTQEYKEDILNLQDLIQKDLSTWLT